MKQERKNFDVNGVDITLAEARMLCLLPWGLTAQQRADVLGIRVHTVNSHMRNIANKFNIHTCAGLAGHAMEHGFDRKGCFKGEYLFEGYTDVPWEG